MKTETVAAAGHLMTFDPMRQTSALADSSVTTMTDSTVFEATRAHQQPRQSAAGWRDRAGTVTFALVGGTAIFVGGTPYFELTPANDSPLYNGILVAALWLLARLWRRKEHMASYAAVARALFVAAAAMLVMVVGPFNWLVTGDDDSVQQAFQDKLAQFLSVVPVILFLTATERRSWNSIYVQKGSTRRWLTLGLISLLACVVGVTSFALADGASASDLASLAPLIAGFAVLNALMEELWFRGILLRPFEAGMGAKAAVAVTALIFGIAHVGATYISPGEQLLFTALVAGLGVFLAWAMRWGNALWGAVMLHVGLDLIIVLEFV